MSRLYREIEVGEPIVLTHQGVEIRVVYAKQSGRRARLMVEAPPEVKVACRVAPVKAEGGAR